MSTFTDETDARIKTQRMLREASESLRKKALAHRSDARKHKMEALKFSRMSRPNNLIIGMRFTIKTFPLIV